MLQDGVNWLFSKSARTALGLGFPLLYAVGFFVALQMMNLFWPYKNVLLAVTALIVLVLDGIYHAYQPEKIAKRVFIAQLILVGVVFLAIETSFVLNWDSPVLPLIVGIIGYVLCRRSAYKGAPEEPAQPQLVQGHGLQQPGDLKGSVSFYLSRFTATKRKAEVGDNDGDV